MITRWSRPIERSRPEYRRSLLRATVLFAFLLLAEILLVTHLVSRDLSRTHLIEIVNSYRQDAELIARRVGEILRQEGKYDLFTVRQKMTTLTQRLNDSLAKRTAFVHLSLYDSQGRLVAQNSRLHLGFVTLPESGAPGSSDGPEADFLRFAPTESPGESGPSPVFTAAGELPAAPADPDGTGAPAPDPRQFGPPAPQTFQLDSSQKETMIIVPLAAGEGDAPQAGILQLGLDREMLQADVAQLQRDMLKKVFAGAFLSLVLLVVGFLYVLKLLQKTRRLEAEAQMADRLAYIGTLASGLAHEIRNPLNAMNMNMQLLEEELARAAGDGRAGSAQHADRAGLLESTKGEIRRLDRLVGNFLAYARPSAPNLEERDLNRVIDEVVTFLRAEMASNGIEVETRLGGALPPVEIDEAQFKQAVLNILINANQVLGRGGRVEIATSAGAEDTVSVRIADNGPGIPPERLEKIFEVFWSTRRGGTGLGLPIAQRIVEIHGGRVEVESEVGRGTTFTIVLPRRQKAQPVAAPAPEPLQTS